MNKANGLNQDEPRDFTIAVIGVGHVGLPTALGIAEQGWNVIGTDQDMEKIRQLEGGHSPFFEPGMQKLLTKHLASATRRPPGSAGVAVEV